MVKNLKDKISKHRAIIAYLVYTCAVILVFQVYADKKATQRHNDQVSACERGNIQRQVLDDFLTTAYHGRLRAGELDLAMDYLSYHRRLVDAVHQYPTEKGSVEVNCEAAFAR